MSNPIQFSKGIAHLVEKRTKKTRIVHFQSLSALNVQKQNRAKL
jgi:hypothetical protein